MLINFDIMAPQCFHEVNKMIQAFLAKRSRSKKKRASDETCGALAKKVK